MGRLDFVSWPTRDQSDDTCSAIFLTVFFFLATLNQMMQAMHETIKSKGIPAARKYLYFGAQ
jgi:preprotein translocase subunit SecE